MLTLSFDPFPELFTERLRLRRMTAEDGPAFFEMRSDTGTMQYIPRPLARTVDDALKLIRDMDEGIVKGDLINWAITLRDEGKLVGTIGYYRMKPEHHRAEVGYLVHPAYVRKGIAHEALQAVLDHGLMEMKLHSIEAVIDPRNEASEKLLLKNGFVKEAHFRENCLFEGEFLDSVHYSLLSFFLD